MLYLGPAAVEALLAIRPQEAVINPGASVFGLTASLAGASMCACFCCCSLLARPADRQLQPVGQLPAVPGADGALGVAVRGLRQGDRHVAVAAGLHRDPPADVAALLQPLRLLDRSAGDREGVLPQGSSPPSRIRWSGTTGRGLIRSGPCCGRTSPGGL